MGGGIAYPAVVLRKVRRCYQGIGSRRPALYENGSQEGHQYSLAYAGGFRYREFEPLSLSSQHKGAQAEK